MPDEIVVTALLPLRYYTPAFLREAIESVTGQTCPHWRLLIVVESEDLTRFRSVLAEWLGDERVRLVPNQRRGYVGAFNTGMLVADTEFIAILLGDDAWETHAVETLLDHIRAAPDVDLLHSGRRIIDGEGNAISSVMLPPETIALEDFTWKSQVKHLICWRRSLGLAVGMMDESLRTAGPDDYDFVWTLVQRGARVKAIMDCLYIYRDHRDGRRNTTHYPRSVHVRDLKHILTKHGVDRRTVRRRIRLAKRGYLRQCMYRNALHRRLVEAGLMAPTMWHEPYR